MSESTYETLAEPVTVNPTATQLYLVPIRNLATRLNVQLTNLDLLQTLNAWVETRLGISDPFYRELSTDLDEIKAGETRRGSWLLRGTHEARVMATASGAGLSAQVTVATELEG